MRQKTTGAKILDRARGFAGVALLATGLALLPTAAKAEAPVQCPSAARKVQVDFKRTYSVGVGTALQIKGHDTALFLMVIAVEKEVRLFDLLNRQFVTINYGKEIKLRERGAVVYLKAERGEQKKTANLSVTRLQGNCNHPIVLTFDVLCTEMKEEAFVVKPGDKIAGVGFTVLDISNKGIKLDGFGWLRYGKLVHHSTNAGFVSIKAKRGTEKGTVKVYVVSPKVPIEEK